MSAARPRRRAKAVAMRSSPVLGTAGTRSRAALPIVREDLREVLVAPAGEADEIERRAVVVLVHRVVQRVRGLERRDDALQPRDLAERPQGVLVADGDVARAAGVAQVGVLGPRAGIVQARGDRVRLGARAVVVLHDRRQRTVQDAGPPAGGQGRAVTAALQALPRRLDAAERDAGVGDEGREDPDRVRAAADAGDDAVGQPVRALEKLGAGLVADDALQASFSVRAPASTQATSAPSRRIRWTLGAWRRMSSAPM